MATDRCSRVAVCAALFFFSGGLYWLCAPPRCSQQPLAALRDLAGIRPRPHSSRLIAAPSSVCSPPARLRLLVGIITAPLNRDRRVWIRQKLRVSEARCRGVRVIFVLGSRRRGVAAADAAALKEEMRNHGDLLTVPARDYLPHAVAEKSISWWERAVARRGEAGWEADWVAKWDDDSLPSLRRIEADLARIEAMRRSHYYYGVMTWRAWRPLSPVPDGVCGARGDDGPTPGGAGPTLQSLLAQVGGSGSVAPERGGNPGECTGALGPFPFADGSLQVLSSDLVRAFAASPLAKNFSATLRAKQRPPFWTHEDAATGCLVSSNAIQLLLHYLRGCTGQWTQVPHIPQRDPAAVACHVRRPLPLAAQQVLVQLVPAEAAGHPRRARRQHAQGDHASDGHRHRRRIRQLHRPGRPDWLRPVRRGVGLELLLLDARRASADRAVWLLQQARAPMIKNAPRKKSR
mmetsp:Transcript_10465/g.33278  ORF Transcript_10465/g.33278 Transcript_10465/m.33278 type:complete len:461 (-) Transcript_10465:104-1486(-)